MRCAAVAERRCAKCGVPRVLSLASSGRIGCFLACLVSYMPLAGCGLSRKFLFPNSAIRCDSKARGIDAHARRH